MISRRTAKFLAVVIDDRFTTDRRDQWGNTHVRVLSDALYDFLYEHDYAAWFCNMAKRLSGKRAVQEWVMRLQTGETFAEISPTWTWKQREQLGQEYLKELGEDTLRYFMERMSEDWFRRSYEKQYAELQRTFELDGYVFRDGHLLTPESDVLNVKDEEGVLAELCRSLSLENSDTTLHHLSLSEEHYLAGKWDDSISNSRKFLEAILAAVAVKHSLLYDGARISQTQAERPVEVRDYLEKRGLLETKEKEALAKIYGLLSSTGGHPYMAEKDQARLLRHMALTFSQFVMLRLRGKSDKK